MSENTRLEIEPAEKSSFPKEFTEEKLLICLNALHESSRISKDIGTEQTKLDSLSLIRNRLNQDENRPLATLENIDANINEITAKIKNLKSEMNAAEHKVVQGFQDILAELLSLSEKSAENYANGSKLALEYFGQALTKTFNSKIAATEAAIRELEANKMDASEEQKIKTNIDEIKANIINVHRKSIATVSQKFDERYENLKEKIENDLKKFDYDALTNSVQQKVMQSLDPKIKSMIEDSKQENLKLINESVINDKIRELVQKEVQDQVGPANLQKIITTLPEYQALKQLLANNNSLVPSNASSSELNAIKESMKNMTAEMVQLKQVTDSTRAIIDTLKTHGLPTESQIVQFDHAASVKHVEEMEREISVMYNSIKMIETVINLNHSSASTSSSDLISRKRPRIEDVGDAEVNSELLERLNEIEKKQQKLYDFIFQCRDTVLDVNFPDRLESAMKKIQQILLNHETFIAFLIDPFTTSKNIQVQTNDISSSHLNPAMLDAISQLVKKTAEEISLPLQKKIKILEEKLESKH